MLRSLYSLLMVLAQPVLRAKLARRGRQEPGYREAVEERFGHYTTAPSEGWVWVHAVSLGETRAAAILVRELRARLPGLRLLLTHGTATGRAEGARLLAPGDVQVWQPWDSPGAVRRFLAHFRPAIGVLMETEMWPNLLAQAQQAGLPMVLANARMNERSFVRADTLSSLSQPAFESLATALAQTEADADRLRALGARDVRVLGNLKFDAEPDEGMVAQGRRLASIAGRPVVMFASSREGEEARFLDAVKAWRADAGPHAAAVQWLIVPRHPQRFDAVAQLVRDAGFTLSRRSDWGVDASGGADERDAPAPRALQRADVWLGDSLGEMSFYYGLASVALLGGSFEPLGGQNLIEAAACGCQIVMGPSTFNFEEAARLAAEAGVAHRVPDLAAAVGLAARQALDAHGAPARESAAREFAAAHRGAARESAAAIAAIKASRAGR